MADVEAVAVRGGLPTWVELHETFTVCIVERGSAISYRCGSRRHSREPGVGMLLGPGDLHVDLPGQGRADQRILRLGPGVIERAEGRATQGDQPLVTVEHEIKGPPANDIFLALHQALDEGKEGIAVARLLDAAAAEVLRRCRREKIGHRRELRLAREYVLGHLGEPLSLDEFASALGMRKWGLIGLFRRHAGVPPLRYALQVRLARARALLAAGQPCLEVASAVGFFDQPHLTRWFRRTYGITPGEYQRTVLDRG